MEKSKTATNSLAESNSLARKIVALLIEKKALDVRLYDVREESSITDFYINATGRSTTQVASLADDVSEKISELGRDSLRIEGRQSGNWILVDYGDVIVNVFDRPSRDFYTFDRLLPKESEVDITDIIKEVDDKFDIGDSTNNQKEVM